MLAEVNRKRRGHAFYPPKSVAKKVPALGATDEQGEDALVVLHYFVGGCDWYITEADLETGEAFGWAEILPGGGEWGYTNLVELEGVLAQGLWPVERDCYWDPKPMREVLAAR